jgi:hypothetical protein
MAQGFRSQGCGFTTKSLGLELWRVASKVHG